LNGDIEIAPACSLAVFVEDLLCPGIGKQALRIRISQPITQAPRVEGMEISLRDATTLVASLPKSSSLNALFAQLELDGIQVRSMRNKVNRLEELFLRLVEKKEGAA